MGYNKKSIENRVFTVFSAFFAYFSIKILSRAYISETYRNLNHVSFRLFNSDIHQPEKNCTVS